MSGYESPRPEDEVAEAGMDTSGFDADDLAGDDRPVDEAAARAHDVQPDDDKPVLEPDGIEDGDE